MMKRRLFCSYSLNFFAINFRLVCGVKKIGRPPKSITNWDIVYVIGRYRTEGSRVCKKKTY
jgi:hypothetical protein